MWFLRFICRNRKRRRGLAGDGCVAACACASLIPAIRTACRHLIRYPKDSWHNVPDFPKAASQMLDAGFEKFTTRVLQANTSKDGGTTKLLVELQDGMQVRL